MSDLISQKAAIKILHYNADESCASVVADFESIPTADAVPVPVVRCKGCVWFADNNNGE